MSGPTATTKIEADPPKNRTLAYQGKLPKLPIPPLADTCRRYLKALEGLQDEEEHAATKIAVQRFLENEGPGLQEQLVEYAKDKSRYVGSRLYLLFCGLLTWPCRCSYIEEFWLVTPLKQCITLLIAATGMSRISRTPTQWFSP